MVINAWGIQTKPLTKPWKEAEEPVPVVFDGGSRYFKVGYGGEGDPRYVFPCVVGHYKRQNVIHGMDAKETFIGNDVTDKWSKLTVKHPIEHGIITNWDDMEKIMFETFKIPALCQAVQDVLSLFSSGRTTGFIVNSGDEVTYNVAIDGGYTLSNTIMNLEVSGRDLSVYLMKILTDKGYFLGTMAEWEMIRDIKEKLCYVALDFIEEMHTELCSIQKEYELPDGQIITMDRERFCCPEAFFQPSMLGVTSQGLHKNIYESLLKCDFEIRKIFYVNTVLCGGSMSFPGMTERMTKEIKAQAPQMTKIKVVVPAKCRFSAWFGGSILTTLSSFQRMWICDYEYGDFGPSIIHRRTF
ncbi:actin, cytoplasmic-like isoform X2 [Macrotis lagotis]|uniref:actin, cytoplasmic-like isoform X2 n=1 Tax=Macrotis lagotis TaxID=92651 RepID=UPI003D694657